MINGRSEKYVSESNRKRHRCGTRIYDAIHSAEENGDAVIGRIRGVYPVRQTAAAALARSDLFIAKKTATPLSVPPSSILCSRRPMPARRGRATRPRATSSCCTRSSSTPPPREKGLAARSSIFMSREQKAEVAARCAWTPMPAICVPARCTKSSAIRRLPSSPAQRTASPMCSLCCRKTSRLTAALFHEEYKTKLPSLFS